MKKVAAALELALFNSNGKARIGLHASYAMSGVFCPTGSWVNAGWQFAVLTSDIGIYRIFPAFVAILLTNSRYYYKAFDIQMNHPDY
ncbi:hypothetical protein LJC15_06135 [Desulfovibrio sp. OttesenSCG-928-G11]|nr:hypothetical protein [Desulfovibrio sp. OttesenSCG-928-G11]